MRMRGRAAGAGDRELRWCPHRCWSGRDRVPRARHRRQRPRAEAPLSCLPTPKDISRHLKHGRIILKDKMKTRLFPMK